MCAVIVVKLCGMENEKIAEHIDFDAVFMTAAVGDFKVKIDQVFDLSAACSGPFGFVIQIVESLFGEEDQVIFPLIFHNALYVLLRGRQVEADYIEAAARRL